MPALVNQAAGGPPAGTGRVTFARLGASESVTVRELHELAGPLAGGLARLGIGRGDRVGVLGPNCLEWVLADLAALRLGAVTVGFDPAKFEPDEALPDRYQLAVLFAAGARPRPRVRPLSDARVLATEQAGAAPPAACYQPEDVTALKLTSGSTGEPKGLTASAGSIDSGLRAVQQMFRHGPGDSLFVFLPLSVLQQRYWIYSALCFGHDVTVSTYEAAYPVLRTAEPTVIMGVPGFYQTARQHIEAQAGPRADAARVSAAARQLLGRRIRYLWTGSAPAARDVLSFFTAAGMPIYEGYGLNETCIVSKNYPGAWRPGSAGRVLPGKRVAIDAAGVITVHSDVPVCRRYEIAGPGDSERVFGPGGSVRTGDLGHVDEDGFLYIDGRADDAIVLPNGRKIIVRPIEERLKASPAIEECVVFCPAEAGLVAVVSPAGDPADETAIAAALAAANAAAASDEQVGRVVVAARFTMANGLLTSQFKPRRQQILRACQSQIHGSEGSIHARRD